MRNLTSIMILQRLGISILILAILSNAQEITQPSKSKRQIYREQVLPSRGGKIPDAAFTSDRLALNRLNKEGIAIPDGVLLEHRHVHSHPHITQHDPEDEDSLIQIVQRPEGRYIAPAGKYHPKRPLTVASTYIIRKPVDSDSTSGLRSPLEQLPYHETLDHQLLYYQLPQKLTAPPQMGYLPPSPYVRPPTIVHHPHPYGYKPSVSYQHVHQSLTYRPIIVPLRLPNKEVLKNHYYHSKGQSDEAPLHDVLGWPYLLGQYTKIADKINAVDQDFNAYPTPQSVFYTPQVLGPVESRPSFHATRGDRYARKSKEIAFTETGPEKGPKDTGRLIKLKCTQRLENSVEDGSSQCFIRY